MNPCIDRLRGWLQRHPAASQWLWFAALWLGGLCAAMLLAYPIKLLIRSMQ